MGLPKAESSGWEWPNPGDSLAVQSAHRKPSEDGGFLPRSVPMFRYLNLVFICLTAGVAL